MMIGYARTSTVDQQYSLDHQRTTLIDTVGCDKVFEEQVSSVGKRLEFEKGFSCLAIGLSSRFPQKRLSYH
jgi:DNA invertase Pin-like site-specific DNA recombinase